MAQHIILIAPEDIKQEPVDSVILLCNHCQLAVEIWVDSNKNTTPFSCDFCMIEGKGDINMEHNRIWTTSLSKDIGSEDDTDCYYPSFNIYLTGLLLMIVLWVLLILCYSMILYWS